MEQFKIVFKFRAKNIFQFFVLTKDFKGIVRVAKAHGISYIRSVHAMEGVNKLQSFQFKNELENRVLNFYKKYHEIEEVEE